VFAKKIVELSWEIKQDTFSQKKIGADIVTKFLFHLHSHCH